MSYMTSNNSLRYERKFFSNDLSINQILNFFLTHQYSFKFLYPDRSINNIYFDTKEFSMYKHGIEGDSRRVKVRMRWYGDLINLNVSPTLELKRKFGHVGDKLKWQISSFLSTETMLQAALKADLLVDNNVDNFEILYTILPIINPVLINRYNRKYLISADKKYRVTIDTGMCYYQYSNDKYDLNNSQQFDGIIVEIKYLPDDHEGLMELTSQIPIRLSKFSKYLNGIEILYKSNKLFI